MKTLLSHNELKAIADKNGVKFDRMAVSSNELEDILIEKGFLEDDSDNVRKNYSINN